MELDIRRNKNLDNINGNKQINAMTEGNPFKLILAFAFPMFIGNIFQQMYNMVDSIVVGN